ncbi:hypothetical protein ACFXG4_44465 [Nocardia sp. NPDC059246]|uniref:DUF7373 family lipoprotein n=1 Tax=unclassified Nocardia TaxID=2637762 RepID=UPI0036764587
MGARSRLLAVLSAGVLGVTACAHAVSAPDHGAYPTTRALAGYDDRASVARGILVESLRIGERLVYAQQIESDLSYGRGGGVFVDHTGTAGPLSPAARSALQPFDVLGGFSAGAGNSTRSAAQDSKSLTITVLALPSEQLAASAAAAMAAADRAAHTASVPLTVPGVPAAQAYRQTGIATAASWLASKSLIIVTYARFDDASADQLADLLARTDRHGAFVARVDSNQDTDVRRLAAAQASLLAQDG